LRRPRRAAGRARFASAIYRDQLAEIDRDLERGLIGANEAAAARTEIERRALAALDDGTANDAPDGDGGDITAASRWRRWIGVLVVMILLPAAAGAIYLSIGRPGVADRPFAERARPQAAPKMPPRETMNAVAKGIEEKLNANPVEPQGWVLLIRLYQKLGRTDDARRIYTQAIDKVGSAAGRAAVALGYGEVLMRDAKGSITPAARAVFDRALIEEPKNPSARYYRGLAQLQGGDPVSALKTWQALRRETPENAPWRERLDNDIGWLKRSEPPATGGGKTNP
jgi:cytochrome c-type biogenesis protein CcmH